MDDYSYLDEIDKMNGYEPETLEEWMENYEDMMIRRIKKKNLKCECGRDKVGEGKHSTWCPLYKENE